MLEIVGVKTRASSCSSASASSSSSVDSSSGEDEPQDSSVTESSPVKQKIKREKVLAGGAIRANKGSAAVTKAKAKKNTVVRNLLASALLSSADDDSEGKLVSVGGKTKKKAPHTRRPLTRRQKSGVKKTIPTTTLFNQRLVALSATQLICLLFTIPNVNNYSYLYHTQRINTKFNGFVLFE